LSIFEFLLALYAIVAGLGVSLLVRSVGQMIEARDRVRLYWVHTCWIALVFIGHVVSWFALWRYAGHAPWTILQALLLAVLVAGALAHLVIEGRLDLSGARGVRAAMAAILVPGIISRHPTVHAVQAALLLLIMLVAVSYVARPIS